MDHLKYNNKFASVVSEKKPKRSDLHDILTAKWIFQLILQYSKRTPLE